MNATTIVRKAIHNTPADYWTKTCAMRAGRDEARMGSYFRHLDCQRVHQLLVGLVWEPYDHPAIQEPAKGFVARNVPGGALGVVSIESVPKDAELFFDDSKDVNKVEVVWKDAPRQATSVDFVVALVGPGEGDEPDCVWTFFPGEPVQPSRIPRQSEQLGDLHGKSVSLSTARELGVEYVKLA